MTGLSLGRIAVGIASLAQPALVAKTMGVPESHPLLTRWFGTREVAIGTATLLASGSARRNLVLIGVAVDGADAATAYAAVQEEALDKKLGLALVGVAGFAVVQGLLGLRVKKKTKLAVEAA